MASFKMTIFLLIAALCINQIPASTLCANLDKPNIITREQWGARKPTQILPMSNPVPFVIIHHSYDPGACNDTTQCEAAMKAMQNFHMDDRGWWDIGYSFGVGGDGNVYEGRGWSRMGAHAPKYNDKSIGICAIGDWRTKVPPANQLKAVKSLIEMGVSEGYISKHYKLLGHRQTRPTECPGQAYYDEIKTWPHYSPIPNEVDRPDNTIDT